MRASPTRTRNACCSRACSLARARIAPHADHHDRSGEFPWDNLRAAPIEDKFWATFCALLEIEPALRDDRRDPAATRDAVAQRAGCKTAVELRTLWEGHDVCCSIVAIVEEAVRDPHFAARGIFDRQLVADGRTLNALPVPVAAVFRSDELVQTSPALGEAEHLLKQSQSTQKE